MICSRLSSFMMIVCFLVLYPLANIQAFDGKREGFCFGAGMGFGGSVYNTVYYHRDSHIYNRPFFPFPAINYKIGYAPSEQVLIYFTTRSSLNKRHSDYHRYNDFYTSGMVGLGCMTFLERPNNFYLFWEFGLATTSVLRPQDYYIGGMLIGIGIPGMLASELHMGPCMSGGIGYEISPNLVFDFMLTYSGFNDYDSDHYAVPAEYLPTDDGGNYVGGIVTFSLAFNVFFY